MEDMRYDMCGAAAVVAATIAAAKLKLPVNIITFAALAENMPGPGAMKPGDVYFARNGKSIEVMNTDAEGRLVLADAFCLAQEVDPSEIIDIATLTGAITIALGNSHTGFFSRSTELSDRLKASSINTGEMLWELPLTREHAKDIKGQLADITNQSTFRGAQSATAAAFLGHFVPEKIPWVHIDIAGTAQDLGERVPYAPKKGASGVMIRTFIDYLEARTR